MRPLKIIILSLQHALLQHGFGLNPIIVGSQFGHFRLFLLYVYTFHSRYNTDWIANMEINFNPNNSVIKRLWYTGIYSLSLTYCSWSVLEAQSVILHPQNAQLPFCTKCSVNRTMRKPTFCIGENKGADQLHSNCEAYQHLCFCYLHSTMSLLSKFKISGHLLCLYSPVCAGLFKNHIVGFLMRWLICWSCYRQ